MPRLELERLVADELRLLLEEELLLASGALVRLEELRFTVPLLLELDGRLLLRVAEDEREELVLFERFRLSERPALLRIGATERLEEVDGREISLLLRFVVALLLRVVGRLASLLWLLIPLVRFKLSDRPL